MNFSISEPRIPYITPDAGPPTSAAERFIRRLAETIEWSMPLASLDNPSDCLRTPDLQPSNLKERHDGLLDYNWEDFEVINAVLDELAHKRAERLAYAGHYPVELRRDLGRGRLLAFAPLSAMH